MKKFLYVGLGVVIGVITSVGAVAFAQNMDVKTNNFPIKVDGEPVNMQGYNIGGHTYFQLNDVSKATGFKVEFKNNTIMITTK